MHILSDGYSPMECFVEFVATGEFPETSSTGSRTNRSQALVATAGFGGLPTLCNFCVWPWGEVNERYGRSLLPHLCMTNEVRQEAQCTTCRERFKKNTKRPSSEEGLLMFGQLHCPALLSDINRHTKAASDVEVYRIVLLKASGVMGSLVTLSPRGF